MKTLSRRQLLRLPAALAAFSPLASFNAVAAAPAATDLAQALAALERRAGGRLGVAALDTQSGALAGHRAQERFGLASTFKLLLAAAVLQHPDAERRISFTKADLVPNSPVVQGRLAQGSMRAIELAEATQTVSDNAAANLLLRHLFNGPEGFRDWLRSHGDSVTRLDRYEPEMNLVPPGEERGTTTPAAMAKTTAHLLVSGGLDAAAAQRLIGWMQATRTGSKRLRAGLPAGWRAGDKTGTGMHRLMADKINDVAIIWPPGRAPWIVAAYYDGPRRNSPNVRPEDQAVLAEVGRIFSTWVAR
jgi:beta-lactamase class A